MSREFNMGTQVEEKFYICRSHHVLSILYRMSMHDVYSVQRVALCVIAHIFVVIDRKSVV